MMDYTKFCYEATTVANPGGAFDKTRVQGDLIFSGGKPYIHPRSNAFHVKNDLGRLVVVHEVIPESICLVHAPEPVSTDEIRKKVEQTLENIKKASDAIQECHKESLEKESVNQTNVLNGKQKSFEYKPRHCSEKAWNDIVTSKKNIKKGIARGIKTDMSNATTIADTNLNYLLKSVLEKNGIDTVNKLTVMTPNQLLELNGIGQKRVVEISDYLKKLGLKLRED